MFDSVCAHFPQTVVHFICICSSVFGICWSILRELICIVDSQQMTVFSVWENLPFFSVCFSEADVCKIIHVQTISVCYSTCINVDRSIAQQWSLVSSSDVSVGAYVLMKAACRCFAMGDSQSHQTFWDTTGDSGRVWSSLVRMANPTPWIRQESAGSPFQKKV